VGVVATNLALDEAYAEEVDLRDLYHEILAMDPTDMIRLTWDGKVVARIIVGA
jgi:hypothetical protein